MRCLDKIESQDGSIKFLWELEDRATVESIAFVSNGVYILCISSQVGCNMGCRFCETGKQKLVRDLTADEMYKQIDLARKELKRARITRRFHSVTVAGMGEPLMNFENLREFIFKAISRGITYNLLVTTCGIVPRIYDLASSPVKLTISLHAANDELRTKLLPVNNKYPLSEVIKAAEWYADNTAMPVRFSYLLFDGLNDRDSDIEDIKKLIDPRKFIFELKPYNPVEGINIKPSSRLDKWRHALVRSGYEVVVVKNSGLDVGGGCGQLRSKHIY